MSMYDITTKAKINLKSKIVFGGVCVLMFVTFWLLALIKDGSFREIDHSKYITLRDPVYDPCRGEIRRYLDDNLITEREFKRIHKCFVEITKQELRGME